MANPPMDQPQRGRRDREMNDLPAEKAPGEREIIRGVGEEEDDEFEDDEEIDDEDVEEDVDR
jgi:hypothetical protein